MHLGGICETSRRTAADMAVRPCRPGNMAAVTNTESHMPLSSFMFKYKHRLWCISGRYFQLSNVNLYLLTFTAGLMPRFPFHIWSGAALHRRRRGRRSQPFSSNFHVGVLDSAVALENTGTEPWNAFKQSCFVKTNKTLVLVSPLLFNKQAIQFKQEVFWPGFQIYIYIKQKNNTFFLATEHNHALQCAVVHRCQ